MKLFVQSTTLFRVSAILIVLAAVGLLAINFPQEATASRSEPTTTVPQKSGQELAVESGDRDGVLGAEQAATNKLFFEQVNRVEYFQKVQVANFYQALEDARIAEEARKAAEAQQAAKQAAYLRAVAASKPSSSSSAPAPKAATRKSSGGGGGSSTMACIRAHESDTSGGYSAENPTSSASGAYQFVSGTWRSMSAAAGYPGYSTAGSAPASVQDAVAAYTIRTQGTGAWAGSGC